MTVFENLTKVSAELIEVSGLLLLNYNYQYECRGYIDYEI